MKNHLRFVASSFAFAGLLLLGTPSFAQNRIEGAVQQGQGAYVQKTDRTDCITNSLLGVPALGTGCLQMQQTKFMVTPSGNAMSVWTGTVAADARPAKRTVFNSTWTETNNDGVTRTYDTVAVTEPSGMVKLTLTDKNNKKGKGKQENPRKCSHEAPDPLGRGLFCVLFARNHCWQLYINSTAEPMCVHYLLLAVLNSFFLLENSAISTYLPIAEQMCEGKFRAADWVEGDVTDPVRAYPVRTPHVADLGIVGYDELTDIPAGSVAVHTIQGVMLEHDSFLSLGTASISQLIWETEASDNIVVDVDRFNTPGGSTSGLEHFAGIMTCWSGPMGSGRRSIE